MLGRDTYELQFDDGRSEEVTVDGRDYLAYERQTGESALDLIGRGATFAGWYAIACAALRRQGRWDGTAAEFETAVTYVLPKTEVKVEDPTTPPEAGESS